MSPELRPLVEAAYAELERQGGETGHLVNREGVRGTTIELMGDFDLAPLVEAVLAAQSESFVAERERSIRAGARRANKRFKL